MISTPLPPPSSLALSLVFPVPKGLPQLPSPFPSAVSEPPAKGLCREDISKLESGADA